jgi:hypothetical protein
MYNLQAPGILVHLFVHLGIKTRKEYFTLKVLKSLVHSTMFYNCTRCTKKFFAERFKHFSGFDYLFYLRVDSLPRSSQKPIIEHHVQILDLSRKY